MVEHRATVSEELEYDGVKYYIEFCDLNEVDVYDMNDNEVKDTNVIQAAHQVVLDHYISQAEQRYDMMMDR